MTQCHRESIRPPDVPPTHLLQAGSGPGKASLGVDVLADCGHGVKAALHGADGERLLPASSSRILALTVQWVVWGHGSAAFLPACHTPAGNILSTHPLAIPPVALGHHHDRHPQAPQLVVAAGRPGGEVRLACAPHALGGRGVQLLQVCCSATGCVGIFRGDSVASHRRRVVLLLLVRLLLLLCCCPAGTARSRCRCPGRCGVAHHDWASDLTSILLQCALDS